MNQTYRHTIQGISFETVTFPTGLSYSYSVFTLSGRRSRCGDVEYVNGRIDRIFNEVGWTDSRFQYVAAVRDSHGSLRATYTLPSSSGSMFQPVTRNKLYSNLTAYYPGGLPFADWQGDDRYLFAGKALERDLGLFTYDFHARTYNPQTTLFNRPDPCADSYPSLPSYLYCAGNPVSLTDPSGCIIEGVRKKDAALAVEDLRAMFPDDEYANFRNLIVQSGKIHTPWNV